jgi:hypothetical protein
MHIIEARNVNAALPDALELLDAMGEKETSRNGPVLAMPEPVVTVYSHPCERVLFSPLRDANPFFHLMESLWMLAGRNDLEFPMRFNKNFASYSDDGVTVHGAYGYRWRKWFGYDQLTVIINELRKNPESRRCVLTMWDASVVELKRSGPAIRTTDLHMAMMGGKDVPCNTQIYFDCRFGKINMTVLCRSNDIWWGCYGANAVHFSILQEFVAAAVGVPVGVYRQFSNNFHIYTDVVKQDGTGYATLAEEVAKCDYYAQTDSHIQPFPLVNTDVESWMEDLSTFLQGPELRHHTDSLDPFFANVAAPMYRAWIARKNKTGSSGLAEAMQIQASDWRMACGNWITRRENKTKEGQ